MDVNDKHSLRLCAWKEARGNGIGALMREGSIYVYDDPVTGRPMYVGSTQDGNMMRRHRVHLFGKLPVDRWLRCFDTAPVPRELLRVKYNDLSWLSWWEDHFMETLTTMRKDGGLNQFKAHAIDYVKLGRLGGNRRVELHGSVDHRSDEVKRKAGLAGGCRTQELYGCLCTAEGRSKGGHNGRLIDNGQPGTHQRWHVNRGVVNSECALCHAG